MKRKIGQSTNLLFVERPALGDVVAILLLAGGYLLSTTWSSFRQTMTEERRESLYTSLASTSGALLGFTLAALAILVALPSTDRLEALRRHPRWQSVRDSYFRAGWALLASLVLCTAGIALDASQDPWTLYEVPVAAVLALSVSRVAASLTGLRRVIAVAGNRTTLDRPIDDP